jgi:hypothetical protein
MLWGTQKSYCDMSEGFTAQKVGVIEVPGFSPIRLDAEDKAVGLAGLG